MAANKVVMLGPTNLTTTIANLFSPGTVSVGTNPPPNSTNTYYLIRTIRVINKTASAIFFALWKQSTYSTGPAVANKEFIYAGTNTTLAALDAGTGAAVAPNGQVEANGAWRVQSNDTDLFIVGGASAAGLTIEMIAEMGIV